jgi:hypothetical protein
MIGRTIHIGKKLKKKKGNVDKIYLLSILRAASMSLANPFTIR